MSNLVTTKLPIDVYMMFGDPANYVPSINRLDVSPTEDALYAMAQISGTPGNVSRVYKLDLVTNTPSILIDIDAGLPTGPAGLCVSADYATLYLGFNDGSILAYDFATHVITPFTIVSGLASQLCRDPLDSSGLLMLYHSQRGHNIKTIDISTGTVTEKYGVLWSVGMDAFGSDIYLLVQTTSPYDPGPIARIWRDFNLRTSIIGGAVAANQLGPAFTSGLQALGGPFVSRDRDIFYFTANGGGLRAIHGGSIVSVDSVNLSQVNGAIARNRNKVVTAVGSLMIVYS